MPRNNSPAKPQHRPSGSPERNRAKSDAPNITKEMEKTIQGLKDKGGLSHYQIRLMIEQSETFGAFLKDRGLKTNQIRKFLDAVNRVKVQVMQANSQYSDPAQVFAEIETDIVLLKPKLAYAAARQNVASPLKDVISAAIDQTHSVQDFERFVQLVESIIAYHKAAGGQ